jgi:hypothetical protein
VTRKDKFGLARLRHDSSPVLLYEWERVGYCMGGSRGSIVYENDFPGRDTIGVYGRDN